MLKYQEEYLVLSVLKVIIINNLLKLKNKMNIN